MNLRSLGDLDLTGCKLGGHNTIETGFVHAYASRVDVQDLIACQSMMYAGAVQHVLAEASEKVAFRIGFVGCGQVGKRVLNAILSSGVPGTQISVATRTPGRLAHYSERGVEMTDDVEAVATSVHLLFVCCLPLHLNTIASLLCGKLRARTVIVSIVAGISAAKVAAMFGISFVLRTVINMSWLPVQWSEEEIEEREATGHFGPSTIRVAAQHLGSAMSHRRHFASVLHDFAVALGMKDGRNDLFRDAIMNGRGFNFASLLRWANRLAVPEQDLFRRSEFTPPPPFSGLVPYMSGIAPIMYRTFREVNDRLAQEADEAREAEAALKAAEAFLHDTSDDEANVAVEGAAEGAAEGKAAEEGDQIAQDEGMPQVKAEAESTA